MALTPEQLVQVQQLFEAALARPESERHCFLLNAGDCDPAVRDEVAALLAYDDASCDDDTDSELADSTRSMLAELVEHAAMPGRIGRYEVLDRIGIGGMGVVYRARQTHPDRQVALKIVRVSRARPSALRRFRTEAESLARLRHPGIAQIYDAGTAATEWGELPYIAMELLEGRPLLAHVRERAPELRARVELLAAICDAVEHAHQNGVMHRDLKPANILVEAVDGRAQPKILDFGVARLVTPQESATTLVTEAGQIVGTLAYMSPEQIAGEPAVDTRTDVYALGAIAFEVLSGRLPLGVEGQSVYSALRTIREQIPPRLDALDPRFRGDLSTIVAKALAKERERRYAAAAALGEDLRRYLHNAPILAQPPSAMYLLRKFAARNRAAVTAAVAVVLALVVGGSALLYGLVTQRRANAALERQLDAERDSAAFMVRDIARNLNAVAGTAAVRRKLLTQLDGQLKDLMLRSPDDPELLDSYAMVLEQRGDLELLENRPEEAERLRRQCLELRERLVAEHPADTAYQARLSIAIVKVGDQLAGRGRRDEALEYYLRALEIDRRLAAHDPGSRWFLDNLAWSYDRIGNHWLDHGNPEKAETLFGERLALTERLLAQDPSDLTAVHGLAAVNGLLADAAIKRRDMAGARVRREAALAAARRLVAERPHDRVYLEAAHHANRALARLCEAGGELTQAALLCDEAIHFTELMTALDPTDGNARLLHFDVLSKRAELALDLGDLSRATAFAERAHAVAEASTLVPDADWPREQLRDLADTLIERVRTARHPFDAAGPLGP